MNPDQVIALLTVIANLQRDVIERDRRISQLEEMIATTSHPGAE